MHASVERIPPEWLVEALEYSEAQIAVGATAPMGAVMDRLRASIARMNAASAGQRADEA